MADEKECPRCASSGRDSCPLHGGQLDLLEVIDWREHLSRARAALKGGGSDGRASA